MGQVIRVPKFFCDTTMDADEISKSPTTTKITVSKNKG